MLLIVIVTIHKAYDVPDSGMLLLTLLESLAQTCWMRLSESCNNWICLFVSLCMGTPQ